ncbi:Fc.00g045170.m01.CDS01 [Cosmosporella sp. VM-42]
MNSPPSLYRYRPLGDDEFRLLNLTASGEKVVCTLSHYPLAHSSSFHALSYAWGTGERSQQVELDGRRLIVTEHLLTDLVTLGRQFRQTLFWIDAICINQADDAEKAVEVPQMADI